jgi:hypothetical protein
MKNIIVDEFKILLENFSIIKELKYVLDEEIIVKQNKLTGESFGICFTANNRRLLFSINPIFRGNSSVYIQITNTLGGDVITLTDWMDIHGYSNEKQFFLWSNDIEFEEGLKKCYLLLKLFLMMEKCKRYLKEKNGKEFPLVGMGKGNKR